MDSWKPESGKESIRSKLWNMDRKQWLILLLLGILLTVIALPVSKNEKEDSSGGNLLTGEESSVSEENKTDLEEKLESLLSSVEGVGEVKVLLMTSQKKENESFYGTQETEVTGVLIAATGADNPVTICNIQNAVEALFQIEAHKIKVMKMK